MDPIEIKRARKYTFKSYLNVFLSHIYHRNPNIKIRMRRLYHPTTKSTEFSNEDLLYIVDQFNEISGNCFTCELSTSSENNPPVLSLRYTGTNSSCQKFTKKKTSFDNSTGGYEEYQSNRDLFVTYGYINYWQYICDTLYRYLQKQKIRDSLVTHEYVELFSSQISFKSEYSGFRFTESNSGGYINELKYRSNYCALCEFVNPTNDHMFMVPYLRCRVIETL